MADTESVSSYTGDGESGVYIYGPQLEEGTTASSFVANTTGSPKFITGATYGPRVPMILVEPSAINQTKTSEDFNSSEWAKLGNGQGSTPVVTDNYDYSPDGTQNATRLEVDLNGGNSTNDQSIIYDLDSSNTVQTISVWMKSNTNESYNIYLANTYLNNGTDIAQVTTQWQRFSFSHTTSNHTFPLGLRGGIGASDSADILIWGAQAEAGSVATSYIPTSGGDAAARTRAADDLEISGSAFTNFFNSGGDGTFYAEFTKRDILSDQTYILAGHSGSQRYFYLNAQAAYLTSYDGAPPFIAYGNIQTTLNRASVSYNATHKEGSLNGSTVSNVTSTGDLRDSTRLSIGQSWNGNSQMNGHIKRLIYWPTHSDSL